MSMGATTEDSVGYSRCNSSARVPDNAGRLMQLLPAPEGVRPVRASRDLVYLVDQPLSAVTRFLKHRPGDSAFLADFATRTRARVAAVAGELEWGVSHGDFGAKNIHNNRAGRMTAFDFDRLLAMNADTWGAARIDNVTLDNWLASLRSRDAEHPQP
jgi:Ser/Thr protein kinase RdoA (MazF antagonist)